MNQWYLLSEHTFWWLAGALGSPTTTTHPFSLTLMLPFLTLEQAARLKKLQEQDKQQKVEFRKRVRATGELKGSFWKDLQ